ncbi:CIA30 family protein [Shewanella sp. 10N.7]|uniref:CIA30 family protein n=2 Tax=Shewanella TaxID=22 RepID=A0ABT0KP21_9GAMM|nr:CIA30 family protein [Shewanella electrodiphila]MCC4834332.1 CIA30 family protein [Shewanella sp. 10N.7]MCL1045529.1 CIA30 family protein [Shewanella electrodiphila]
MMKNSLANMHQLLQRYTSVVIGVLLKNLCLCSLFISSIVFFQPSVSAMEIQFNSQQQLQAAKISNDTVMGGISSSEINRDKRQDKPVFSGNVSLANNGGFASMEYRLLAIIPRANAVKLTVIGDGKRYQLRFKTPKLSFGEAYVAHFDTIAGQRTEHRFTPDDFNSQFRGRNVNAPELLFEDIDRVGLLIADKQQGDFSLMLDTMTFTD